MDLPHQPFSSAIKQNSWRIGFASLALTPVFAALPIWAGETMVGVINDFEGLTAPGTDFHFHADLREYGSAFVFKGAFDTDVPTNPEISGTRSLRMSWTGTGNGFCNIGVLPDPKPWVPSAPLDLSRADTITL